MPFFRSPFAWRWRTHGCQHVLSASPLSLELSPCDCLRTSGTILGGPAGEGKGEWAVFQCGHREDSAGLRLAAATRRRRAYGPGMISAGTAGASSGVSAGASVLTGRATVVDSRNTMAS